MCLELRRSWVSGESRGVRSRGLRSLGVRVQGLGVEKFRAQGSGFRVEEFRA